MTTSPARLAGCSWSLFDRACNEGDESFADGLRSLIEVNQCYFSFPLDDAFKPSEVRKRTKRISKAGTKLLDAIAESYSVLRANIVAEEVVSVGSVTDDGGVPALLQNIRRDLAELLALSVRIHDGQPRVNATYGGRPVALGVLRHHFEKHGVPWTSTCPIDPADTSATASLAVEAVSQAFGLSWSAASKAIQRMDKSGT